MRLISLSIHEASDPQHLAITFDDGSPHDQTITTAIVGQNGAGKSQLLESLVLIFRDLDLGRPPAFPYELVYSCREHQIHIDADPRREQSAQMRIKIDDTDIAYPEFSQDGEQRYLPSCVIGYQSDPSHRMAELFSLHEKRFYQAILEGNHPLLQNVPAARLMQSHFALLPYLQEQDPFFRQLLDQTLGIKEVISVLPVVRKLPWTNKEGNFRLWDALEMMQQFFDYTLALALAPVRPRPRTLVESKEPTGAGQLRLSSQDEDDVRALERVYSIQQDILTTLASTYLSKIFSEAKVQVEISHVSGYPTIRDLSAGEQQLLTVLSLLRFVGEDEALFLLDGPDTYLHPEWSINFLKYVSQVTSAKQSHILMTSHNPLTISSLEPRQVRVLYRNPETGRARSYIPFEGPRKLDIDGILTSDIFRLRFAIDVATQRLIDERRSIVVKDVLTDQDKKRLDQINDQLNCVDFQMDERDEGFALFIKRKIARENAVIRQQVSLTPEEYEEQRRLMEEIIDELEKEGKLYEIY